MPVPILAAIPVVGAIVEKILSLIDKAVPDKDLAEKLKMETQTQLLGLDYSVLEKELDARAKIITAEISGESILARNWRPILMLTIVAIVANNYLLFPYINLFYPGAALKLELPDALWNLMSIGVGGYIVSRGAEKVVTTWKGHE